MIRKYIIAALSLILIVCMIGCGEKEEVSLDASQITEPTVNIKPDGSIEVGYFEEFTKDYYSVAELEEYAQALAREFNESEGTGSAMVKGAGKHGDDAALVMVFKNCSAFGQFREDDEDAPSLQLLSTSEAQSSFSDAIFRSTRRKNTLVKGEEAIKAKYDVVSVSGDTVVVCPDRIMYYTEGTPIDDYSLRVSGGAESVIVYKR